MARSPLRRGLPRPTPQRPLAALAVVLLMACCLIPAVSATILYDEEIDDYVFTGESYTVGGGFPAGAGSIKLDKIGFNDIAQCNSLSYITIDYLPNDFHSAYPDGTHYLEYWYTSNPEVKYPLTATITTSYNLLGQRTNTRIQLFFPEWDIGSLTGAQTIQFSDSLLNLSGYHASNPGLQHIAYAGSGNHANHKFTISSGKWTKNHITISDNGYDYTINLQRVYGNQYFKSDLVAKLGETIRYSESGSGDLELKFIHSEIDLVELSTLVKTRIYPLGVDQPGTSAPVTVYVRNSQTGALLANAHIVINASVNNEFFEVVNESLPSGIYTGNLQPTGGGLPNPDYYRLWVTLDGYNSQMPYIDFELTGATTLYVYMEPTAGGPDDENKTYIEFYVRDLNANPIAGAAVTCGGYTLITNSAGYTQFELPNNAAYPYRVTKSGYITIEGTATVADDPRYTVNVVLGQGEIPTLTPTPTAPGATPTPDRRTNEQKGQAVIDMIADNAEGIGALALICLIMGLLKLLAKW